MIEEYGVKLDNFTYDKLQCFFDDFIDEFEVDALYVFVNWVLEDIDIRIKKAKKAIKIEEKLNKTVGEKEDWQEVIEWIRNSQRDSIVKTRDKI